MGKVYVNQTALRLNFSCSSDITGFTSATIQVLYPNASTATWTATVDTASTGSMHYNILTSTSLKSVGLYKMQPLVTLDDGSYARGETVEQIIYDNFG